MSYPPQNFPGSRPNINGQGQYCGPGNQNFPGEGPIGIPGPGSSVNGPYPNCGFNPTPSSSQNPCNPYPGVADWGWIPGQADIQPRTTFPYNDCQVKTPEGTVALMANVQLVINAINCNQVIPFGDYGGPNVYYFQTIDNGLGNIVYTIFDKATTLGLASFSVRFSSYAVIYQILFEPWPRSQIDLQFLILPPVPINSWPQGCVTP